MSKKILILCPYPLNVAPSQRLRFEKYFSFFRENGFEVDISPFISNSFWNIIYKKGNTFKKIIYTFAGYLNRTIDLFRLRKYDIVYVHLWVTPFGYPFFEWCTKQRSRKLVYDIDDLIYTKIRSKANPMISIIKGREKPVYLFKRADHVITSSATIEEFARKFNEQVSNIPVSVNTEIFVPKVDYSIKNKLVLGWTGSLSTSPYMHLLDEMLLELRKEIEFKLLILGDPGFTIEGLDIEAISWSEEREVPVISSFDIGLYPLPDEQWVHGKGGGKALQYMALGVPTVASAIGMNLTIIRNGESGFLVKTKEQWKEAIRLLYSSQTLRETIGRNGVATVEKIYSIQANENSYLTIFNRLA